MRQKPSSFWYFGQDSQSIGSKQAFHKTITTKTHGLNFVVIILGPDKDVRF